MFIGHSVEHCCLQLGRQVAWRIVFVTNDIITFVDCLKQCKSVADTEDCRQTSSEQLLYRRTGILVDLSSQLTDEFLLALFNVRLHNDK